MSTLEKTCAAVVAVDVAAAVEAQRRLDAKTKPRKSLGELENLARRLAAIYGIAEPPLPAKAVVVMAADHGVAEEGVSAYPSEVTAQMVCNFVTGGAAINVLARHAGARVVVVDMGTQPAGDGASLRGFLSQDFRDHRLGPGTANFTRGPAMARTTAVAALEIGVTLARQLIADGIGLIAVGDMGIANTTSASALTAAFTGAPVGEITGRGTGIDDARLQRKIAVIGRALAINKPDRRDPVDVVAKIGGFEIAGLAGVMLGAAAKRVPIVLDGFITTAAALIATALCPQLRDYLIAGHCSVEPGHAVALRHLDLTPLLSLHMRLGEGTGAVLAMNLAEAALRILREMATFDGAGVSDAGA
jgi:nicotinate-nucleotide--dimethylbenzimidazole phosphoribosyltransferase